MLYNVQCQSNELIYSHLSAAKYIVRNKLSPECNLQCDLSRLRKSNAQMHEQVNVTNIMHVLTST